VREADFWDGRAPEFSSYAATTGYAEAFIAHMKMEADHTILDMACGGGTLAMPLATKVKSITAVDFSQTMLDILGERCRRGGITNVRAIRGRWEDDWSSLGIGAHDIAIASRSLLSKDVPRSIAKLNGVATRRVYITTAVGTGPFDGRLFEAGGRAFTMGPDYIYYYNLLYEIGLRVNVAFIEEHHRNGWGSHEEALEDQRWMFHGMTEEEEEKVRLYLRDNLVAEGGLWRLPYSRRCYWALMWWENDRR
jgi:hypothetical protein